MLRALLLLLACAASACAEVPAVRHSVVNWAVDLRGVPDERPFTWGCTREEPCGTRAESVVFNVDLARGEAAEGRRIRVLRIYGGALLWPQGTVEPGRFAGVLVSLHSEPVDLSSSGGRTWVVPVDGETIQVAARANFSQAGTFYANQWGTDGRLQHARISEDVSEIGLLGPDNILRSKLAVWMNSTGRDIHFEIQLTIVWQWEQP